MLSSQTSTWFEFGVVVNMNLMPFWRWPHERVLWYSMISCLVTAFILLKNSSSSMLKNKSSNKFEEWETILVWFCGLEIMKFFKEYILGVGVVAIIRKIIINYSSGLFLKYWKNKTLKFHIFHLHLLMGLEMQVLTVVVTFTFGECGLEDQLSKHIKMHWDRLTVSLVHKLYLYGKQ